MTGWLKRWAMVFGRGARHVAAADPADPVANSLRAAVDRDEGERRVNLRAHEARIALLAGRFAADMSSRPSDRAG